MPVKSNMGEQLSPESNQEKDVEDNKSEIIKSMPIHNIEDLPSNMIPYPEGAEISYRSYGFGEIKNISQSELSELDFVDIVMNGIYTNFDKKTITFYDFLYIAILRKLFTIGNSKAELVYICPHCEKRVSSEIDMAEDIDFEYLKTEELPISTVLDDGNVYEFHPFTIEDYKWLVRNNKFKDYVAVISLCCKNREYKETYKYIMENSTISDGETLLEVEHYLSHDMKRVEKYCPKCKSRNNLDVSGRDVLIRPFHKRAGSTKHKIWFGNKDEH